MKILFTGDTTSLREISKVLHDVDPVNIADLEDEYDPEAEDIAQRVLVSWRHLLLDMIKEVFEKWFHEGIVEDEYCRDILVRLEKFMPEHDQ